MTSDERDRQFERALHRHLCPEAGDASCLDAETLAAYHDRTLSLEELTRRKEHISGCVRCQETLVLLEETNSVALHDWEANAEARLVPTRGASVSGTHFGVTDNAGLAAMPVAVPQIPSVVQTKIATRPKAWRWVGPAGVLAAGLLVFVAVREYRSRIVVPSPVTQVAENREAAAPSALVAPGAPGQLPHGDAVKMQQKVTPPVPQSVPESKENRSVGAVNRRAVTSMVPLAPRKVPESSSSSSDQRLEADKSDSLERQSESIPMESRKKQATPPQNNAPFSPRIAIAPAAPAPAPSAAAKSAGANAVVGGAAGALKKTEDSGANNPQSVGSVSETVEVQAAPDTSTKLSINSMNYAQLRQIAATNPQVILAPGGKRAWRIGTAGTIESSNDAGITWKAQKSDSTVDLTAGSASSNRVCWVVGKVGTILLTTDGGKHWKPITSPLAENLGGVHATDAKHASIWNVANTKSFETADGGMTWTPAANE